MSFIKSHYEKIILAVLLLVFIIALVLQLRIIKQSMEVGPHSLQIRLRDPDHKQMDFSQFDLFAKLDEEMRWKASGPRNPDGARDHSDFMVPIQAARCPHCAKLIPVNFFTEDHQCPECGGELKKLEVVDNGDDTLSGIERDTLVRLGIPVDDPDAGEYDHDGDGFTIRYEEHIAKTDPGDPMSRPPLALRLILADIRRQRIPLEILGVSTLNSEDKKIWMIQANVGTRTGQFLRLNGEFNIDGTTYRVLDVDNIIVDMHDPSIKAMRSVDRSVVTIQKIGEDGNLLDEPVKVTVREPALEPRSRALLRDVVSGKEYIVSSGDVFAMGDETMGVDKYTVLDIRSAPATADRKVVISLLDASGEPSATQIEVSTERQIPEIKPMPGSGAPGLPGFDDFGGGMPMVPGGAQPGIRPPGESEW